MDIKNEISNERQFLHDLATPISIVRLHSKRLLKLCLDRNGSDLEKTLLEQILDTVLKMEELHSNFKNILNEDERT